MKISCSEKFARLVVVLALPLIAPAVHGGPGHHEAHVHGVAELTVALEGTDLEIVFTSPAISVVGFEHKAVSPAQIEAVAEAEAALRASADLFTFSGTQCALRDVTLDLSAVQGEAATPVPARAGHEHHVEHEVHQDHGDRDGEVDIDHEAEAHSDVSARYAFRCGDTGRLQSLRVGRSGLPFGLETINVMWVSGDAQGATVLDANQRVVAFR